MIPQDSGSQPPAGAERLSVRLRDLRVEGEAARAPEVDEAVAALQAELTGKSVTAAAIFGAAARLERAYARAGYALVRVVLPAQRLDDGADLRLKVIDGVIERVDVSALPSEIRDRVAALLADLVGRRGLSLGDLERRVLLAGDTPGTVLRSTLAAGAGPGATILVVEARYKPVTGTVSLDNTLGKAIGSYTLGTGFDLNSPTGNGETLYFRAAGAPYSGGERSFLSQDPRNRSLAAGLILPLGVDGLTLNLEVTDARTTPHHAASTLGFASDFSRYSARLRYPLIRSRDLTLNLEGAFDAQDERVTIISPSVYELSRDRLRIARAGADLIWFAPWQGVVTGRLVGSFGIDGLGARDAPATGSDLPGLSRLGSRPEFQKLDATLGLNQPILEHLSLDLRLRGQTAFNQALPRSEQIGLASLSGLSAFDAGLFQGDEGFVTRGEVQFPISLPFTLPFALPSIPAQLGSGLPPGTGTTGAALLSPYVFGAVGVARLQDPTALEHAVTRGVSYGVGLRIGAAPQASFSGVSLSLEYGHGDRSDRTKADDRLTFTAALQF